MIDFIICYEHIVREVENDTLLKYELNKRGFSCEIIPFNGPGFYHYSRRKNRAKVVVTPWLRYDENTYHYLQLSTKANNLVNLQWEQVYSNEDLKFGCVKTCGEAQKSHHICWGDNSKNRLIDGGCDKNKVVVTGAIQQDYGRSIFNDYYYTKEQIGKKLQLDIKKKWILIVSSFAFSNYGDAAIEQLEKQFQGSLEKQVKVHQKSQKMTLDWIDWLLEEYDCEVIYRPHPSENINDSLNKMGKKWSGFHVISDYSVKQWAKVCDKVNLWISTSNAELAALGVDYAIIRPFQLSEEMEVESMKNEVFITSYEMFHKYNTALKLDDYANINLRLERLSYFYNYDNEIPAYVRVADYLEKVLNSKEKTNYCYTFKQRREYFWLETKKKIVSLIMELEMKESKQRFVKFLPLGSHIKKNLINSIANYYKGKKIEKSVISYMETMSMNKVGNNKTG